MTLFSKACLCFFSVIAIRVEPARSNAITHEAINSGIVGVGLGLVCVVVVEGLSVVLLRGVG